ncbi:hypothetical protein ACN20G_36645 (plasmid) [Streptomyces sp. BI20]|uniref:hypothetical protein n=1 Tax=Streptomyces sp. BI20 TaxID=3403460 RepID=UPI003C744217
MAGRTIQGEEIGVSTPEEQAQAPGQAFEEAAKEAAEAAKAAVKAFRLCMAMADTTHRKAVEERERAGAEEPDGDGPDDEADRAAVRRKVREVLPEGLTDALLSDADWPTTAGQLVELGRSGVDVDALLPRLGDIAVSVRTQVPDHLREEADGRGAAAGEWWTSTVREAMPAGPVREAILSSPQWPDITAAMSRLREQGADVKQVLAAAYEEAAGVARASSSGEIVSPSEDARRAWGPLTQGLDVPKGTSTSATVPAPCGNSR